MRMVIQLGSDSMGRGDEELGRRLMTSFLNLLAESETLPETVVLFNAGVKLVCEGSDLLEVLEDIEKKGVTFLACGTCLNHFNLADKVRVGRASNMLEISTAMFDADKVVPL